MPEQPPTPTNLRQIITEAVADPALRAQRRKLLVPSATVFDVAGRRLMVAGHFLGPDRATKAFPFGHGSDEVAAVGLLLRFLHELVAGAERLLADGFVYGAAALIRQTVEIEYLAWAFDTRDRDAQRWLRSDKAEREKFFSPRKLRGASGGKFRGQDYGHHCEMGGHPTPVGLHLMIGNDEISELMMVDLLGHAGRTWDHFVSWSTRFPHGEFVQAKRERRCCLTLGCGSEVTPSRTCRQRREETSLGIEMSSAAFGHTPSQVPLQRRKLDH